MRIGLFTDTYFPQVSGVATSIKTLKTQLEKQGHTVFIFTTTDKDVNRYEDWDIIRIPSVPFFAFKDRRIAYRGFRAALKIAERYQLDIIHTHTEFSLGMTGKYVARALKIPIVHTYHTQYEDYVHYIAKGMIIRPSMVKYILRAFMRHLDGVICPSEIARETLDGYKIKIPKRVIPTGIELKKFERPEISQESLKELRVELGIADDEVMLLSLSRVSYEKNIQAIVRAMPDILKANDKIKLIIVGDGPYSDDLRKLVGELGIADHVVQTGMVAPSDTARYYKAADFFISASTSETQGLTYSESLASGTPVIAHGNPYLEHLISDKMFGMLFYREEDLAAAVIDALAMTPTMEAQALADKLFDISAENFGQKVYEYYLDLKISYNFNKDYIDDNTIPVLFPQKASRMPIVLAKSVATIPKKLIVGSSRQSRKLIRVSARKLKNLRRKDK